jgi:hypothetical protein
MTPRHRYKKYRVAVRRFQADPDLPLQGEPDGSPCTPSLETPGHFPTPSPTRLNTKTDSKAACWHVIMLAGLHNITAKHKTKTERRAASLRPPRRHFMRAARRPKPRLPFAPSARKASLRSLTRNAAFGGPHSAASKVERGGVGKRSGRVGVMCKDQIPAQTPCRTCGIFATSERIVATRRARHHRTHLRQAQRSCRR